MSKLAHAWHLFTETNGLEPTWTLDIPCWTLDITLLSIFQSATPPISLRHIPG